MRLIHACVMGIAIGLASMSMTGSIQAAPFHNATANGTSYQFQSVQDLLGSTPRNYIEAVTMGAAKGFVGSASETQTPLGQIVRIDELSYGAAEVFAIFDKLGAVRTTTLLAYNETPLNLNQNYLRQNGPDVRKVNVGGPVDLYPTPEARRGFNFPFPLQPNEIPEPASSSILTLAIFAVMSRRGRHAR
ncbi:hypothetical protein KS4_30260 [Poriferisphaera corsica]|uniref:PEP-CTERM sorting domain-containing protein n=1 Tax=Poriferisphaera corsica TaxID=2528020 RepID=A0A517YXM0_9BACT|nr:hypothetical protein [Poriferisphaera corsica]QDU34949.1 hypothetical protein KS4_30260 [Poriferisphaera corsica]